jgi:histidine triad (HIT) family protein
MWWASRALEQCLQAEHVYWVRLGHGWPHLHLHIVARHPGTPEALHGLEVKNWSGIPDCDMAAAIALAQRLRAHIDELSAS